MNSRAAWVVAAGIAVLELGPGAGRAAAQPGGAASATGTATAAPTKGVPTRGASPGAGSAAPSPKARLAAAESKLKAGDYAGALQDFQAVDAEKPSSESARGIAVCQEKLGNAPEAVAAYQKFLAAKPAGKKADIDAAEASITALQKAPAKLHVDSSPPHAKVSIDGAEQPGPTPVDVELPAGTHVVHVSAEGKTAIDRSVTLTFGQKQEVIVELEPLPVAAVPPPPAQPPIPVAPPPAAIAPANNVMQRSLVPAVVTGALAIAAAGVGTAFGIVALSDKSNFDKNPTSNGADTGENHALVADMSFGIAVTLAVTSAVLFLTRDEAVTAATSKNEPQRARPVPGTFGGVQLVPTMTPQGGGAGALIRF